MKQIIARVVGSAVLFTSIAVGPVLLPSAGVEAAQPWYCVCLGVKKRYLASTRHCEFAMGLPKGQWCTRSQYRKVYGPACRQQGCRLPLFN